MSIVRDNDDRWRFLKLVRYLNDENVPRNWERDIGLAEIKGGFVRPTHWPKSRPYVSILAYCLMDNHFHLLVRENLNDGVSRFMHRLGTSMSKYFNEKYGEVGTLFEGPYQSRVVDSDRQLQYLQAYIHVKNPFERFPGGLSAALQEFDQAFDWACKYRFAGTARDESASALIDIAAAADVLLTGDKFRAYAREVLQGRLLPSDWDRISIDI